MKIAPWQEGQERWRGLRVTFADNIVSHSRLQDFYFGDDGLLRRHDYHVDVARFATYRPCAASASCPVSTRTNVESPTAVSTSPA